VLVVFPPPQSYTTPLTGLLADKTILVIVHVRVLPLFVTDNPGAVVLLPIFTDRVDVHPFEGLVTVTVYVPAVVVFRLVVVFPPPQL
jgi:hypothetical protein